MALRILAIVFAVIVCLPGAATSAQRTQADNAPIALWITRFDYRTPADVRQCIDRAADLGMTDVFWQVRGQGDAFYKSDLEPWGQELLAGLPPGSVPSFDPLALAVELAHARNMRLHAWVNIMPLWKGMTPPASPRHPYNAHPEWRLRDAKGQEQKLNEHYVIVNPVLPAVQDHIVAVCRDLVNRYPIDGMHMDYVRFVSDTMKDPAAFPGDRASIFLFEKHSGRTWTGSPADLAAFRDFKRDRISDLVRRIKSEAVGSRPGVLSGAVWRRPDLARDTYLQDAAVWLKDGTLDRAFPMIYTKDDKQFAEDLGAWLAAAPGTPITPGLGIYLHSPGGSGPQIDLAARRPYAGVSLFAYSALFESADPTQDRTPAKVAERAERLRQIRADLARLRVSAAGVAGPRSP